MKNTTYGKREFDKDFPTDEACLDFIFDTLHSRKCSCGGTYNKLFKTEIKDGVPVLSGRRQYQCSKCRFQIAPTAGTIFHKSATPLKLWLHAIWVFSNAKSGISAKEMQRQLGVTYKCAYRILSLIKKALKQDGSKLKGDVEIDSGYFGGKGYGGEYNKHFKKAIAKKILVTVAIERGGRARAEVMDSISAENMTDFIERNVDKNARLITDGSSVYKRSGKVYNREFVNHKHEYVRGDVHVNSVETFFAHLKRSIAGTYKSVSKKHFQSYLDAFAFQHSNRHNDKERFEVLLGTLLHA